MSIFKQQKRLWFLAGAGFSGLGLFTLEVWHLCKPPSDHAALLPYCGILPTISPANLCAKYAWAASIMCALAQREAWQGAAFVGAQLPGSSLSRNEVRSNLSSCLITARG